MLALVFITKDLEVYPMHLSGVVDGAEEGLVTPTATKRVES